MVKTDRDNDLDGGGGNSNDFIVADGNGVFDTKVSDEAEYDDEQTERVAGEIAECNESSKTKMKVGVMRWRISMETQQSVQERVTFTVCTTIAKSTGHAVL